MSDVYNNIKEIIGKTPLAELNSFKNSLGFKGRLLAKLEYFNPAGSVKDRAALYMINDALEKGLIDKNSVIIEPTSGNTGIGLAAVCANMNIKTVFVMPETMSVERQKLLKAYGAELVLTDGSLGMNGAIERAKQMTAENKNAYMPAQFANNANVKAHFETTGPEIYNGSDGNIDAFVAGVGSGGTVTGTGKYLKTKNENIKIIAVEPFDSPFLSKGERGTHKIQGIGAGFKPFILDLDVIDEIMTVKTDEAYEKARLLAKTEGYLVGISSGAALHAAVNTLKEYNDENKTVVALLPDGGERYLSTDLFD